MIGGAAFNIPVGSVWRCDDGYMVRVVAHDSEGTVYVRHANGRGNTWGVNPAWFETWERTGKVAAMREP